METPVSTQWIDQYLGISDIDNPSFEEVRNFMILWNLFESLLFQGSYSNLKAIHKSQSLQFLYLQPIITQYFIDNKSEIWLLFLIAHSKR